MVDHITLQCRCGKVRGKLKGVRRADSRRIVCLCSDCQAFAHYLGRAADVLDPSGGTDILPVHPAQLTLTGGAEQLKCLRLARQGLLRWYTACCKTPIGNCMPQSKLPYVGVIHSFMNHAADGTTAEAALGPIQARIMGKSGIKPLPAGTHDKAPLPVIFMSIKLIAKGLIKGRQRPSAFFDESGRPSVEPYVLTADERDGLRKLCGPR